jgi:hypothetical protein
LLIFDNKSSWRAERTIKMAISNVSRDRTTLKRKIDEICFDFPQMNELCRLCLETSEQLYNLDSDFCILVMESGASVTIADALKYLDMDLKIPAEKEKSETALLEEENEVDDDVEPKPPNADDDPNLPKVSFSRHLPVCIE